MDTLAGAVTLSVLVAVAASIGCTAAPSSPARQQGPGDSPIALPTSYTACREAGGELEPEDRGGRCFAYYTPRRDVAAYARCRDVGGTPRVVGPGRSVSDQSHVCTLIFSLND